MIGDSVNRLVALRRGFRAILRLCGDPRFHFADRHGGVVSSCSRIPAMMFQVAMNSAAITGPITSPLKPKSWRPPNVVMSTT